jgi:hypothetical protein
MCENRGWERNGLMAKTRMICPFSGVMCKDCPVYRGRHYFLCFCEKYRGHLAESGKAPPPSRTSSNGKLEIPPKVKALNVLDPFKFDLFDVVTKENKKEG